MLKENIVGVVRPVSGGFGFLQVNEDESYFISKDNMSKLRPGDEVSGNEVQSGDKTNFIPSSLISKGETVFLARVIRKEEKFCFVKSEESFDELWYYLPPKQAIDLSVGDLIRVDLVNHPFSDKPSVKFIELIAKGDDPTRPWKLAFEKNGVEYKSSLALVDSVRSKNIRDDMRDRLFVTIDSASTKDMDDAIFVEKNEFGMTLYVAIADPTEMVTPGTDLFNQAKRRGYTVYSPGWTVPMLNNDLSENDFSLVEGEDRDALVCVMNLSDSGELLDYSFKESVINSKAKLSYDNVSDWLDGKSSSWSPGSLEIENQLKLLKDFYLLRSSYRKENNLVFPDKDDFGFKLKSWLPVSVFNESRRTSNKIVEEAMILSNIAAARFFGDKDLKGIFVSHSGIDTENLDTVSSLVSVLDSKFTPDFISTLSGYIEMRNAIDSSEDLFLDLMVRSLSSRTEFVSNKAPHFGLGVDGYASWTSPIRKFVDIVNHLVIKSYIRGEDLGFDVNEEILEGLKNSLISQKRTEKEINDYLNFKYIEMKKPENETYEVLVIGITKGGLRVVMDETDKLIFVSKLALGTRNDPAIFDVDSQSCTVLNGRTVKVGDKLSVTVKGIDFERKNLKLSVS